MRAKTGQRNLRFFLLLILAVCLLVGVIGWFAFIIVMMCIAHPPAIAFVALAAILLVLWFRTNRRIERGEIRRFAERPPTSDVEFLRQIKVEPGSLRGEMALRARRVFAGLGSIEAHSVRASDLFYPDLGKLPFYDSMDSLGVILELEKSLEIEIDDRDAGRILEKIDIKRSGTVGEAVLEVLHIWEEKRKQERTQAP